MLVQAGLDCLTAFDAPPRLLDLGTGSGAIALALAAETRARGIAAIVTAVEVDPRAMGIARRNAERLDLDVQFLSSDWFSEVNDRYDVIVSNPPYIAAGDRHLASGDLRFEPRHALVGGPDGLDAIRTIVAAAPSHLQRPGFLAIEHGNTQGPEVRSLLEAAGFGTVATVNDLADQPRVTTGRHQ